MSRIAGPHGHDAERIGSADDERASGSEQLAEFVHQIDVIVERHVLDDFQAEDCVERAADLRDGRIFVLVFGGEIESFVAPLESGGEKFLLEALVACAEVEQARRGGCSRKWPAPFR